MKPPVVSKLLDPCVPRLHQELFERLAEGDGFMLERIVSFGHVTAPGSWYDQDRDEWVLLLSGAARLSFEDADAGVNLVPGDAVLIRAHQRHRVDWTKPDCETVWLALHFRATGGGSS